MLEDRSRFYTQDKTNQEAFSSRKPRGRYYTQLLNPVEDKMLDLKGMYKEY